MVLVDSIFIKDFNPSHSANNVSYFSFCAADKLLRFNTKQSLFSMRPWPVSSSPKWTSVMVVSSNKSVAAASNLGWFSFKPITLTSATLGYVSTPADIVWNFTPDVNDRPVYEPIGSFDPEWYDTDMLEVIVRALNIVGCNLQLGAVLQYAENIKNGGQ